MIKKVFIVLLILFFNSYAYAYIDHSGGGGKSTSWLDDRYVNESGDTMEGELSMGGFDLHFDDDMYFDWVDAQTLKLYVSAVLVHTWSVVLADEFILLEDGVSFCLLEIGDKIILE